MTVRRGLQELHNLISSPLPTWLRPFAVVAAIMISVDVWQTRGALVGVLALVLLGSSMTAIAFAYDGTLAWIDRHPVLSTPMILGFPFCFLASLGSLSLTACAAITLLIGVAMVPGEIRRRRPQNRLTPTP